MKESVKQRALWLDLLKTIAMYAVIFYHLGQYTLSLEHDGMTAIFNYFLRSILCIGVPLFFTINGALLLSANKTFDLKKHFYKVIHIIIITFLWGLIIKAVLSGINNTPFGVKDLIIASWNGDGLNYLWFMKSLLTIYVFYPIIQAAFKETNQKSLICFIVLLGTATFGNTVVLRLVNSIYFMINGTIFNEKFNFLNTYNDFQRYNAYPIVYFVLGGLLIRNIDKIKKVSKIIYIALIICCMIFMTLYGFILTKDTGEIYNIAGNSYNSLSALVIVVSLFGLCADINITNKYLGRILSLIGQNTIGIYFLHIPIGYTLSRYVTFASAYNGNELYKLIFSAVVMILTLIISCLLKKAPLIKKMFHT